MIGAVFFFVCLNSLQLFFGNFFFRWWKRVFFWSVGESAFFWNAVGGSSRKDRDDDSHDFSSFFPSPFFLHWRSTDLVGGPWWWFPWFFFLGMSENVYTYIYTHTHTHIQTHSLTYKHTRHARARTHTHTHTHTHKHTHTHTHTQTHSSRSFGWRERWCCLLVLDSVTSAPQCIRQPRPRVYLKEGTYHTRLFNHLLLTPFLKVHTYLP